MARKFLFYVFVLSIAAGAAFGQSTTTWISPYDPLIFLPGSMIAFVSNGIYLDEWDIVVRSPAELSNHNEKEGYNVYTGYGNYERWTNLPSQTTTVNPFPSATDVLLLGSNIQAVDLKRI